MIASVHFERTICDAREGSREALGELFEQTRGYLLHVASHGLGVDARVKGDAHDIVQETFLEAYRDFARFTGRTEEELLAWLRQRMRFKLLNFARMYVATAKRSARREIPLDHPEGCAADLSLADRRPSPVDMAIARERDQIIRGAIETLTGDFRRVLELRFLEGCSYEEIGRTMRRTPSGARKLCERAIDHIIRRLGRLTDD
jgi:RNA polymerase sigma-70 factor (ECF subfamily)